MSLYKETLEYFNAEKTIPVYSKFDDLTLMIKGALNRSDNDLEKSERRLPYAHISHSVNLDGDLYEYFNAASMNAIVEALDGIVIKPDKHFSFWQAVGKPLNKQDLLTFQSKTRDISDLSLHGSYYMIASLIYYTALHTELSVVERQSLGLDFDANFFKMLGILDGCDAMVKYRYRDLRLENKSPYIYQLKVKNTPRYLRLEWRSLAMPKDESQVFIEREDIQKTAHNEYYRHNVIYKKRVNRLSQKIKYEYMTENHRLMLYRPKRMIHYEIQKDF